MDWLDYLRDQAANYRQLAEQTDDPLIKVEMLELASVALPLLRPRVRKGMRVLTPASPRSPGPCLHGSHS